MYRRLCFYINCVIMHVDSKRGTSLKNFGNSTELRNNNMSLVPGKYQHYKNENIDDYLTAIGVPYFGRKMISMSSPLIEITIDGEMMTVKNTTLFFKIESTFKIGDEYDEKMPKETLKSKTTIINDHEMETVSITPSDGLKNTRRYFFTEDECVITMSHEKANSPAKRYFHRIK